MIYLPIYVSKIFIMLIITMKKLLAYKLLCVNTGGINICMSGAQQILHSEDQKVKGKLVLLFL